MFLSQWREFPSAPCLAGGEKKTSSQLASRCWNCARPWHASDRFLPGRAKDFSALRYKLACFGECSPLSGRQWSQEIYTSLVKIQCDSKRYSISYVCISWTIHGMWMIYITFERGGPKFSNIPLERSPSTQPCSSVSWEQNGYYAAQDFLCSWVH